eukprot:46572-Rhodomonas_salina.1
MGQRTLKSSSRKCISAAMRACDRINNPSPSSSPVFLALLPPARLEEKRMQATWIDQREVDRGARGRARSTEEDWA